METQQRTGVQTLRLEVTESHVLTPVWLKISETLTKLEFFVSIRDNLSSYVDGYKDIHKDNYYFSDADFNSLGKDKEQTDLFMRLVDPKGTSSSIYKYVIN